MVVSHLQFKNIQGCLEESEVRHTYILFNLFLLKYIKLLCGDCKSEIIENNLKIFFQKHIINVFIKHNGVINLCFTQDCLVVFTVLSF